MRKGRRASKKIISVTLLLLCVGLLFSVFPNINESFSRVFPSMNGSAETNIAAAKEVPNVVEKVEADTSAIQNNVKLVAVAKNYVSTGASILGEKKGDWIPGDESYKTCAGQASPGTILNCKLQIKAGKTTIRDNIFEKKEPFGMNFLGNGATKKQELISKPGDPKVWGFVGLCSPKTGKMAGVATINFSAIPIPKFLTQGLALSMRQVSDQLFAEIDKDFMNGLTPEQYENFCGYVGAVKNGKYYQEIATGMIYKPETSANSMGNNFFSGVGSFCASRAPGAQQGSEFSKPWTEEEQGLETVTYKLGVDNNVQDADITKEAQRAMIDKGLSGLRGYNTQSDNFIYLWQPKQAPKQVKTAGVSVGTKVFYDRLVAAPTKNSKSIEESGEFDSTDDTTIRSTGHMIQNETSRETIIAAVVGGMYQLPVSAIASGNDHSMLYFDPVKADPKQTYCDPNAGDSKGRCVAVNVESSCAGGIGMNILGFPVGGYLAVKGDVRLNFAYLSAIDTQRWAALNKEEQILTYNNAGKKSLASIVERPNLLANATIEQIALISDEVRSPKRLTNRCATALRSIVSAQVGAGLGTKQEDFELLAEYIVEAGGFKMDALLALPVQVTGNVYMPFWNVFGKIDARKSKLSGKDYIPALYELKLDDLWGGVEGLSPGDINATQASSLIDAALQREGVFKMEDGRIDCEPETSTKALMWPCQTTGGALFGKCQ